MVDKIRRLCKAQGKSLFSLEQECGFGNGVINKWDKNSPSVAKVVAVADALGVPVSYLIEEKKEKPTPEDGDGLDEQDRQLMELMKLLTADQKEFLRAQLLTLTGRGK